MIIDYLLLDDALLLDYYVLPSLPTAMASASANILLSHLGFGLNNGKFPRKGKITMEPQTLFSGPPSKMLKKTDIAMKIFLNSYIFVIFYERKIWNAIGETHQFIIQDNVSYKGEDFT